MELNFQNSEIDTRTRCDHCGLELNVKDAIVKNNSAYCCNGCYGVSNLIYSLGLEEYYNIKDFGKHNQENPVIKADPEDYSYLNQDNFIQLYTSKKNPIIY